MIGNAISYRPDPIQFLRRQQARHGDVFVVNLGVTSIIYFMGASGVNAIFKGTESAGVSLFAATSYILGGGFEKCIAIGYRINVRVQC